MIAVLVISVVVILISSILFRNKSILKREKKVIIDIIKRNDGTKKVLLVSDIPKSLPESVGKWLLRSGCINNEIITSAKMSQIFQMKLNEGQDKWETGFSEQVFSITEPAFIWSLRMKSNKIIPITGRDLFLDGKGSMLIKLFSIFPVVNIKNNHRIDQSTMQRYLGEMIWMPTAILSPYISWREIENNTSEATMTWNGISVKGVFFFDENGDIKRFEANRYKNIDDAMPTLWIGEVLEIKEIKKRRIPTKVSITWKDPNSTWTWAIIDINDIIYNDVENY